MEILRVAILDFCKRRKGKSFCPSEVVRQIFPEDWRIFMPDIQKVMLEMYREGIIDVTQNGQPISLDQMPVGPIRISASNKLS